MNFQEVIDFWFSDKSIKHWFLNEPDFDDEIRYHFFGTWKSACRGELYTWRKAPAGRLAEIIVLDQFSRNLNRSSAMAYQQDTLALALSQELIFNADWQNLSVKERAVSLLPWMHSESLMIHEEANRLYAAVGDSDFIDYESKHRQILTQFGRYPHRNAAMGRTSTSQEKEWLKSNEGF